MLSEAILVHGVIGYKFCWLLPSGDQNQGTSTGHKSNGAAAEDRMAPLPGKVPTS